MHCNILILKEHPDAVTPSYAYNETSAAFDITCVEDTVIKARGCGEVPNGLRLCIPEGLKYYMTIHLRSSFGFKRNLVPHAGIVDAGYTGPLRIKVYNLGDEDVTINKGERYAQVLVHHKIEPKFTELSESEFQKLEESQLRGNGGFGSSDGNNK